LGRCTISDSLDVKLPVAKEDEKTREKNGSWTDISGDRAEKRKKTDFMEPSVSSSSTMLGVTLRDSPMEDF
jgi:hypothetical protein